MLITSRTTRAKIDFAIFVFPILLIYIAFFVVPLFVSVFYSFVAWDGLSSEKEFVGFGNYVRLFADPNYRTSLSFTVQYVLVNVVLTNLIAMALAILLDRSYRTKKLMRLLIVLPNTIAYIAIGFIWRFIFTDVSSYFYRVTGFGLFNTDWLGDFRISVYSVALVAVWHDVGYIMLIYLAGLQTIDAGILSAAAVDGAHGIRKFLSITFPLLMPSVTVSLFMTIAQSFRLFDLNIALTKGGPGYNTTSLALSVYREAFKLGRIGYGSAKAVILFIMVLVVTILQIRITKKREVEL